MVSEASMELLLISILFLLFALVGGYIALRFKLSLIPGYILGGLALGFFAGGRISDELLSNFTGLSTLLILFAVGLEATTANLRRFSRFSFVAGGIQLLLSAFFIAIIALFFQFPFIEALFIGCAFALSSTAVVLKILQSRQEEETLYGGLTIGLLMFQNLAAIPIIIIASSYIATENATFMQTAVNVLFGVVKGIGVLLFMYIIGNRFVEPFFKKMAKTSRELFNVCAFAFVLGMVYVFVRVGLPLPLVAFITGVLSADIRKHHYHVLSQFRLWRDVITILFLVFLGASVKLDLLITALPSILAFSLIVVAVKMAIILAVLLFIFKFHSRTSFSVGASLSHVGEFSFIILTLGQSGGVLGSETYTFALACLLLTILMVPFFMINKDKLYNSTKMAIKRFIPPLHHFVSYSLDREPPHLDVLNLKRHIVLCGYGLVGTYIGRVLSLANLPFIVIDYDDQKVQNAKKQGVNIIYGDPTTIDVLDYAQCEFALCLISTIPEKYAQESIILNAKRLNPHIIIFSRIARQGDQRRLKDLGAERVIHPEFEAALSISRQVLSAFKLEKGDIIKKIKRLKIEHGMQ